MCEKKFTGNGSFFTPKQVREQVHTRARVLGLFLAQKVKNGYVFDYVKEKHVKWMHILFQIIPINLFTQSRSELFYQEVYILSKMLSSEMGVFLDVRFISNMENGYDFASKCTVIWVCF